MKKKRTTIQYARALYEVTRDQKGAVLKEVLEAFVQMLAREHHLKKADKIISEFIKYHKSEEGVVPLEVISAREMNDRDLVKIGNIFSEDAEVTPKVDPGIIGGVIVKTDAGLLLPIEVVIALESVVHPRSNERITKNGMTTSLDN